MYPAYPEPPRLFEADLDDAVDVLHGAKRADLYEPILAAGEPESAMHAERLSLRPGSAARRRSRGQRAYRRSPPAKSRALTAPHWWR